MNKERMFRVGDKPGHGPHRMMPWAMIELHEAQAVRNHSQSLATLDSRGGLTWSEAIAILEDRSWRPEPKGKELVLRAIERWKADEDARVLKGALVLWHRFAPGHVLDWEDENHKAEYLDAVRAVMKAILE